MTRLLFSKSRRRAFTLIELLVAIALGVLILSIVAVVFARASVVFNDATARIEALQNARVAMDMIERDLQAAYIDPAGRSFVGSTGSPAPGAAWAWTESTGIAGMPSFWFTTVSEDGSGAKVGYHVAQPLPSFETGINLLIRESDYDVDTAAETFAGATEADMVAYGVQDLTVRYFFTTDTAIAAGGGGFWTTAWDSRPGGGQARRTPVHVMVRIEVIDRKGLLNQPGKEPVVLERIVRVGAPSVAQ